MYSQLQAQVSNNSPVLVGEGDVDDGDGRAVVGRGTVDMVEEEEEL